jgi:hypothetical protein
LLKRKPSNNDLQGDIAYEKLVYIEGASTLAVCIGFGPNRPLLSPANIRTAIDLRALHVSLDGMEKIRTLAKLRPKKKKKPRASADDAKPSPWSHEGTPRVSCSAVPC